MAFKLNTAIFDTIRVAPPPPETVAKATCPFHVPPWKRGAVASVVSNRPPTRAGNGLSFERILTLLLALYAARLVLNGGDWAEPWTFFLALVGKSS